MKEFGDGWRGKGGMLGEWRVMLVWGNKPHTCWCCGEVLDYSRRSGGQSTMFSSERRVLNTEHETEIRLPSPALVCLLALAKELEYVMDEYLP